MASFKERLRKAQAEIAQLEADPLRPVVERTVRGMEAISTVVLLDLIGLPATTANARRVAATMRGLGFVPLKTRRLLPGGHAGTVVRGWTRPVRANKPSQTYAMQQPVQPAASQLGGVS